MSLNNLYEKFLLLSCNISYFNKVTVDFILTYFKNEYDIVNKNLKIKPLSSNDENLINKIFNKIDKVKNNKDILIQIENSINILNNFNTKLKSNFGNDFITKVISIFDDDYPILLKKIPNAPLVIFVLGKNYKYDSENFAIVGTRKPSNYSEILCNNITLELSKKYVIVSGLALGIDSIAHKTTLNNNQITYAVLGTGIDVIYPKENEELYYKILLNGALISEFLPGTQPLKYTFVLRNRIITGLSKGVLVCGAGYKSGALISANYAIKQSKPLFTIVGDCFREDLSGCHELIKQGKAKLALNAADILNQLENEININKLQQNNTVNLEFNFANLENLNSDEKEIIKIIEMLCIKNNLEPCLEEIFEEANLKLNISINKLLSIISELELKNLIKTSQNRRYKLNFKN